MSSSLPASSTVPLSNNQALHTVPAEAYAPAFTVSPVTPGDYAEMGALHDAVFGPGALTRTAYRLREGMPYHSPFCRVTRNAGGLGDYSAPFEHLFGVEPVQGFTYDRGELSWEESEYAILYEVERAPQGTGAYIRIFTGSDTIARDTPPQGTWTYRVRATNGTVKSEWVEVMVVQG